MITTKASIDSFLSSRKIAITGVSRDPRKFGNQVFKALSKKGVEVFPVNPNADVIDGTPCFRNVSSLPVNVHHLLVMTPKKLTAGVISEALKKGIDNIWIQQGCVTPEALELVKNQKINLVAGECILLHTEPVSGVHKFHRTIKRIFGMMPK